MTSLSRVTRVVLIASILIVPASSRTADADPPGTPATHAEWLDRLFAATITRPSQYTAVSAGSLHSCGLKVDQSIACWGSNSDGQTTVPEGSYTAVSAGGSHTCAVRLDHTVACWGRNTEEQTNVPRGTYSAVTTGENYTCALSTGTILTCWGRKTFYGNPWSYLPFIAGVEVAGSNTRICVVTSGQQLECWLDMNRPVTVNFEGTFTSVSAGHEHHCGLRTDQGISCWGNNNYGQTNSPAGSFTAISGSYYHTCGLRTDKSIVCWGNNNYGETTVLDGSYSAVSAGTYHTCGLRTDGDIACWGYNPAGQLIVPADTLGSISDAGVEQYVTDLETDLDSATNERDNLIVERDGLLVAPACELKVPSAKGVTARVSRNKVLSGTARWNSPATKANITITISRPATGATRYWAGGSAWTTIPTSRTVSTGTTYGGVQEAPWKLNFLVEAEVGHTYTIQCSATDTLGNMSPTPDVGKLNTIA